MSISEKEVALVESSWQKVAPIADTAAELFYGRLFELDPSLKSLFSNDMKEQGKKLMKMIGIAVNGLRQLDALVPALQDMGKRHVGYGVRAEHYQTVGEALLWTLEQGLGDEFTDDVRSAWTSVYIVLASTMTSTIESTETEIA